MRHFSGEDCFAADILPSNNKRGCSESITLLLIFIVRLYDHNELKLLEKPQPTARHSYHTPTHSLFYTFFMAKGGMMSVLWIKRHNKIHDPNS